MRLPAAMLLAIFASLPSAAVAGEMQPVLVGDTGIHDPSVIVVEGVYTAFGTGTPSPGEGAIRIKTSPDGLTWHDAGTLGVGILAWVMPTLHASPRELWAPSVSQHAGTVYLYYAASIFGVNTSAIGLTTNSTFDPKNPAAGWTDAGLVLMTGHGDNFNAIDPARIDTPDGRAWLALGSFWSGIKIRELDPVSGKLNAGNPELYSVASRGGGEIEAASILRHGDFYYLFVSFDRCCAGTASTYRIMVGRSANVTGALSRQRWHADAARRGDGGSEKRGPLYPSRRAGGVRDSGRRIPRLPLLRRQAGRLLQARDRSDPVDLGRMAATRSAAAGLGRQPVKLGCHRRQTPPPRMATPTRIRMTGQKWPQSMPMKNDSASSVRMTPPTMPPRTPAVTIPPARR
jgi:arabinan endo-1,5-alpha-L-arabinosidase